MGSEGSRNSTWTDWDTAEFDAHVAASHDQWFAIFVEDELTLAATVVWIIFTSAMTIVLLNLLIVRL